MLLPRQLQTWTSTHLRGVAWYLECGPQRLPNLEGDKFKSLEAVGGVVLEDEKVKNALKKTYLKVVEKKKK
jgi:7-keto-8-aminopelargonate synthetase-like enzyme